MQDNKPSLGDFTVGIVMPVHNAEKFIRETIDSLIAQTFTSWKLYAVNDHSTDRSVKILEKYRSSDERINILHSSAKGAACARNLALLEADTDYIAFLDADDIWLPRKLELQLQFMIANKIDFSFTPYEYIDENSKRLNLRREVPNKVDYHSSLIGCRIGCSTVIYKSAAAPGIQTASLAKRNDDALWLRIFKKIDCGYRFNESLTLYRKSSGSLSSGSKYKLLKYHFLLYRKNEKFGVLKSAYYTFRNVLVYLDVRRNWEHEIK